MLNKAAAAAVVPPPVPTEPCRRPSLRGGQSAPRRRGDYFCLCVISAESELSDASQCGGSRLFLERKGTCVP